MRYLPAAIAVFSLVVWGDPALACRKLSELGLDFRNIYPTGGEVSRFTGAVGRQVMGNLSNRPPGHAVAFLYSGDGPVTGARGRYLYVVVDDQNCILHHDWIDGAAYDQAVPAE